MGLPKVVEKRLISMAGTTKTEPEIGRRDKDDTGPVGPRIRCPLCRWSPRPQDRWSCTCGETWNTFDTGGICPGCMHQWTSTQCLQCGRWSPHSDWYEY